MTELLVDVVEWAWDRHHNVLSWYIRPLFLLPFAWFAYRRSPGGIAATVVALDHVHGVVPGAGGPWTRR